MVVRSGQKASGGTVSTPRYPGGRRPGPADPRREERRCGAGGRPTTKGKGTLDRVNVKGSTSWGDDIMGIATFLRDRVARPLQPVRRRSVASSRSEAYSPAADGSGFPAAPTAWLATARDVSAMTSIYVDGDLFAADGGALDRFVSGKNDGWDAARPGRHAPAPGADVLARRRAAPTAGSATSTPSTGRTPGSSPSTRTDGTYHAQYRLAGGAARTGPTCGRCTSSPGVEDAPATLVWLSRDGIHQAVLEAVPDDRAGRPRASPSPRRAPAPAPRRSATARSRPRSPDRRRAVIPLRDANPTRRPAVVTLALVVACCVAFAWELGLLAQRRRRRARTAFITDWGVVPAELTAAWGRGDFLSGETATLRHQPVPARRLAAPARQHALPVDLREQRRGPASGRLGFLALLPRRRRRRRARPGRHRSRRPTIPTIGASGAIAATLGAYFVLFPRARVTSLVFLGFFYQLIDVPAVDRARLLVRAPALDGLASLGVDPGRRGRLLRPHRRVRPRGPGGLARVKRSPVGPAGRPAGVG